MISNKNLIKLKEVARKFFGNRDYVSVPADEIQSDEIRAGFARLIHVLLRA